jgi:hypothetical protein
MMVQGERPPGWCDFEDLYDHAIATAKSGDVFVELGAAFGRSTAYMGQKIIESGKQITFYTVDPWFDDWHGQAPDTRAPIDTPGWGGEYTKWQREQGGPFNAFVVKMREFDPAVLEAVHPLRLYSWQAKNLFAPESLHFVFIDANHTYPEVKRDIEDWVPLVKRGGILGGHDYTSEFSGVVKAVDEKLRYEGSSLRIEKTYFHWRKP